MNVSARRITHYQVQSVNCEQIKTWISALTGSREHPMIAGRGFLRLEFFVRFLIPQITTVLLLAHFGFGCCWHHAHTCDVACCNEPAPTAEQCSCDSHSHGNKKRSDDTPVQKDETPHRHECDGSECVFMPSEPSPELSDDGNTGLFLLASALLAADVAQLHTCRQLSTDRPTRVLSPPVRAHLLFSILLI